MALKQKIGVLRQVMSPNKANITHEELKEEWLQKLTANDIVTKRNDLFYLLREYWLRSFHFEDLQVLPEEEGLKKYLPWLQLGLIIFILIKVMF